MQILLRIFLYIYVFFEAALLFIYFYILFMVIDRYCKRAKNVFEELKKTPYVVELDLRGLFTDKA